MAKLLKLRRGTTTQHGSFTGAEGELTIDTTKDTAVVHDGSQAGGRPLLREDMANLPAGTIDNADVNASAAIAGTKISPDFGSQDITTTGKVKFANVYSNESDLPSASTYHGMFAHVHSTGLAYYAHGGNWIKLAPLNAPDFTGGIDVTGGITATGNLTISNANPIIYFTDTNNNSDFRIQVEAGSFLIEDTTNSGADRFVIDSNGTASIAGNLDVGSGIDVTSGNITLPDAGEIRLGDSGDLQIYHTGGASYINDTGTGPLRFVTDSFEIRNAANNGTLLAVSSPTGNTSISGNLDVASGVDVTGNITCTGTVDGRDVAADGTKLDGIESGATADQSASEIMTLIHGQNVFTTGHVGRDDTDYITFSNNVNMDIVLNGSTEFRFESDGDFHADGDVIAQSTTTTSDRRLKENIEVIPNALDKVQALNGVSFDWKKTGEKSAGVIAQEVQEVLPEAVKEVTPVGGGDSHLTVNYHALTSILIESIKELKAEIEELKGGK